ncbi:solute carrier family 25 member 44-like [Artemia franciscana]|uniref:solute carrier family 25 member 44-like n=1 Tax=Artemia franciscana TaxID=6661 RepID=UPI0032DAA1AC
MPSKIMEREMAVSYVPGIETDPYIRTIEWEMMDKSKFFSLNVTSSFIVRTFLYPFTVIKTRLQIQKGSEIYKGTFDAFRKITKYEGTKGFYKGFWVNSFTIISGSCYVLTYENVRHLLHSYDVRDAQIKALVAGGSASLVGQTIIVPVDIISQHLMLMGQFKNQYSGKKKISIPTNSIVVETDGKSKFGITSSLIKEIYKTDGLRGFYRGYIASLCTYVPNSALWWSFYQFYQDQLHIILPFGVPLMMQQVMAAMLGGLTTTVLINPIDIVRARLQVQRLDSIPQTFAILWSEEKMGMFKKGLSARMVSSLVFSFSIILGYESIKRLSIKDKYKPQVRW